MTTQEILGAIEKMTVLELNELIKAMQERWGVTPAVAVAAAPGAISAAEPTEKAEEKTSFSVVLTGFGEKKVQVIKTVREITNLGLKEAKELVESAPKAVKEDLPKEEAEALKAKIVEAGGTAELK